MAILYYTLSHAPQISSAYSCPFAKILHIRLGIFYGRQEEDEEEEGGKITTVIVAPLKSHRCFNTSVVQNKPFASA